MRIEFVNTERLSCRTTNDKLGWSRKLANLRPAGNLQTKTKTGNVDVEDQDHVLVSLASL